MQTRLLSHHWSSISSSFLPSFLTRYSGTHKSVECMGGKGVETLVFLRLSRPVAGSCNLPAGTTTVSSTLVQHQLCPLLILLCELIKTKKTITYQCLVLKSMLSYYSPIRMHNVSYLFKQYVTKNSWDTQCTIYKQKYLL